MHTDVTNPGRRSFVSAAAWSVPVVALAVAAPSATASTTLSVDLWSTPRLPNETADGQHQSLPYYQGLRTLTFTYTFGNNGPDDLPVGALITIGLPFAAAWDTDSMQVTGDPQGKEPVFASTSTTDISTEDGPSAFRQNWHFVLSAPIPAGTQFNVTFQVDLTTTWNTATNYYRVAAYSNITTGNTGITDTNAGNNSDRSGFAYFNKENIS